MKVTVEIKDYSSSAKPNIRINSCFVIDENKVEIQFGEDRCVVDGEELIQAIKRCQDMTII